VEVKLDGVRPSGSRESSSVSRPWLPAMSRNLTRAGSRRPRSLVARVEAGDIAQEKEGEPDGSERQATRES